MRQTYVLEYQMEVLLSLKGKYLTSLKPTSASLKMSYNSLQPVYIKLDLRMFKQETDSHY